MSLGIGHFSVGAAGCLVFLLVTGLHRRTTQDGAIAIVSGLWAMLPDLDIVLPVLEDVDHRPVADLFWFHYSLDANSFTDGTTGSAVLVGLLVAAVLLLVLVEGNVEDVASNRNGR